MALRSPNNMPADKNALPIVLIVIVCLLAILLGAGIVMLVLGPGDKGTTAGTTEQQVNQASSTDEGSTANNTDNGSSSSVSASPNGGPSPENPSDNAVTAEVQSAPDGETVVEEPISAEDRFLKSINGWWVNSLDESKGQVDVYYYYHDGIEDYYSPSGEIRSEPRTISPSQCVYIASFPSGGDIWNGGPGWFIRPESGSGYGLLVPDSDPDSMVALNEDGTGFTAHYTYMRVDPPAWAAGL